MKIGFAVPDTGSWATPDNQVRIAQRAEELGYHSLWVLHRLLSPTSLDVETYRNSPDPLVTLGFLAGQTSRVRLGVAVLNLPFFSPALLAHQTATLDRVSGGRLDVGLGLGWLPEEFTASGVSMERRGARAEEFIKVLNALWTEDVVDHAGEFYQVPSSRSEPKPSQSPRPPLLLGAKSLPAYRRVGRVADGWISSSAHDLSRIDETIEVIRQSAREAGRDAAALRFIVRGTVRIGDPLGGERRLLHGSYEQVRADFATLAAQGVTEVFVDLNFDDTRVGLKIDPAASMAYGEEVLAELAP